MRFRAALAFVLGWCVCSALHAQAAGPSNAQEAPSLLNGPWKFAIGDNPQWSQPEFNDSSWQDYTVDAQHPVETATEALNNEELPGWQRHGHPGYTGYAWYRIRVQAPPSAQGLAVLMPRYVDDGYEVYINGRKIGSLGKLDGWRTLYYSQPEVFPIPHSAMKEGVPNLLAIRVWSMRWGALPSEHNLDGGLRGVPLLGPTGLLRLLRQGELNGMWATLWPGWLLFGLFSSVGLISLFLFFFSRSQSEYLWAGISLTSLGLLVGFESIAPATRIPFQFSEVAQTLTDWVGLYALPLAGMHLLGVSKKLWRRLNYGLMLVNLAHSLLYYAIQLGFLAPTVVNDRVTHFAFLAIVLGEALLLLAIAIDGLRTIGRKAWLPLTPGLVFACGLIAQASAPLPSAAIGVYYYLYAAAPIAVLVIFLIRFTEQQRENVRLSDDMKQAQEVQQVLLPEELPKIAGLTIKSEYRPAREVGGDFFQIVPHPADGSVLIVVGDVTGKGLQAGMLVALIVGAIRTAAQYDPDPLHVLQALNDRLCGRGQAHATCLVLSIAADGVAVLANAGHLPPYLNGKELPMEGAVPLGMMSGAEFSVMRFRLAQEDMLVLMSDGVAEAQDRHGSLFGFERIRTMLQQAITAEDIATAAQQFGQEDDITVLTVARAPKLEAVPA